MQLKRQAILDCLYWNVGTIYPQSVYGKGFKFTILLHEKHLSLTEFL